MASEKGAALAVVREPSSAMQVSGSIRIGSIEEVFRLANELARADGFIPRAMVGKPASIAAAIMTGIEMGIGPMEALRNIFIIEGKSGFDASYLLALMHRNGIRTQWLTSTTDTKVARLKMTRVATGEDHVSEYTLEMAREANLLGKDNWKRHLAQMLRRRAVGMGNRDFCPEVTLGAAYERDELDDAQSVQSQASSGSPEVRLLNDVQDAAPDDGEPDSPEMEHAMYALSQCKTDGDMRTWIRTFSALIEREPQTERKVERWKTIGRTGARVTPPVRKAELTDLFRQAREARAKPQPVSKLGMSDGEAREAERASIEGDRALALQHAMDTLPDCETREMLYEWSHEHQAALAALEVGSAREHEVWGAIRARCESVGIDSAEIESRIG